MIGIHLLSWFALSLPAKYDVELVRLDDVIPEEVALKGEVELERLPSLEKWKSCVPRESKVFSEETLKNASPQIFEEKENEDLRDCKVTSCAFNFLTKEVEELSRAKATDAARRPLVLRFIDDRVKGKTPADPRKTSQFFKSSEKIWEICGNESSFQNLLDSRPGKKAGEFRFSVVKYKSNMRPTLRLLQGNYFQKDSDNPTLCYGEALDFATHYDIDRVELWSWQPLKKARSKLSLQIRHRVDLLNTWARRLSKPSFVKQLEQIIESELDEAANCFNGKN